jgi:hypothetical protein
MAQDLVSRRLRNMLMDHLSGVSVLREIENEFEAAGITRHVIEGQSVGGARRSLVQEYYNGLDFTDRRDTRKFLDVLSVFLRRLERHVGEWGVSETFDGFIDQLRRDGYAYHEGTIGPVSAAARLADAKAIAERFDAAHIHEQIQRIEASIDTDPSLAIGTAKELVESCFKTILNERDIDYDKNDDLLALGKKVFKALKLVRDDVSQAAKGAETIRRVLSNLSTIVQGVAELRGLYGTGHGKDGKARGLQPRHARLVVGSASSLVTFVFETHLETREAQPSKPA